jgi:hypothetical protein
MMSTRVNIATNALNMVPLMDIFYSLNLLNVV